MMPVQRVTHASAPHREKPSMGRHALRSLPRATVGIALTMVFIAHCSDPVVGGSCVQGYTLVHGRCVPSAVGTRDAGADGGFDATLGDSSLDGSVGNDAISDAGMVLDGVPIDQPAGDAQGIDGSNDATGMADTEVGGHDVSDVVTDATTCGQRTLCGSVCVDLTRDGANCGACGVVCATGTACSDGVCVAVCPTPTTRCFGSCTDVSSDPDSCGACGAFCASGICNGGMCRTARAGHVAVIGHDYTVGRTDQNFVVGNAVFLSGHVPVRILSLATYADPTVRTNVDTAIRQVAGTRAWSRWEVADPTALGTELTVDHYDVFLVYAQDGATDAQVAALARTISAPIIGFAGAGGVVVLLDGAGSNAGSFPIVNAIGMMNVASDVPSTGDVLDVVGPADALAVGLPANYRGERSSVSFSLATPLSTPTGIGLSATITSNVVVQDADWPVVVHGVVVPSSH